MAIFLEAFARFTINIHNNVIPTYILSSYYVKRIILVPVENAKLLILCPKDTYNLLRKINTTNHVQDGEMIKKEV